MRRRPGWQCRSGIGASELRGFIDLTGDGHALGELGHRVGRHACGFGEFAIRQRLGKRLPSELLFDRIRACLGHGAPVVDAAGRTRRNASHAQIALGGVHHVVVVVVRDRVDGARRFARVAPDADLRIDQVLLDEMDV
jgi:hypothetical protein